MLGVTEPFSCGIGGGGFMVIRTADGAVTTIDGRETAPQAMRPDSFWEGGVPLPFNSARFSGLSAGVPGTVRSWDEALRRYGTMKLAEALRPAIEVARQGFVVDQTFFDQTLPNVDFFDDVPSTAAIYLDPDGTPRDVGTVLRNPDLARAYERIAHLGTKGFYRGAIADAMVEAVQDPPTAADANHVWRPGVMTMPDVKAYAAPEREPARVGYRGLDVYGMGPPSSGGSTVGEALNILEGFSSARRIARRRSTSSSRPRGFPSPTGTRTSPTPPSSTCRWPASSRTGSPPSGGSDRPRAGCGQPRAAGRPYPFDTAAQASVTALQSETTTHLTVADRFGNVVSYTFTIESTGGNGIVVPGWGFLLNNELTDFNFDSLTHPNRVEGGKRPRSSMSPTIVLDDGQPFLALGSPGGSTIITTVLQLLVDRLDLDATLPEASPLHGRRSATRPRRSPRRRS